MKLIVYPQIRRCIGIALSVVIVLGTAVTGLIVLRKTADNPRTDDAEVFANYIGMAPVVNGPVIKLHIADNQYVKKGDLLFEIDPRPFVYALENAQSSRSALEGQIGNERLAIAAAKNSVSVALSGAKSSDANVSGMESAIAEASAEAASANSAVERAQAELEYANDNLSRLEPLLKKQFVTADQVDQARTLKTTRLHALEQARAQLAQSRAHLEISKAHYKQSLAMREESQMRIAQAAHNVNRIDPLMAQRSGKDAATDTAQYNLDHTRVYAPFDARVTNLTISEGAYAHAGQEIITLIDTRTWWVMANFRETQIGHIQSGMPADVYILSRPNVHFQGVVDSVGYGVTPDADTIGRFAPGLPDVQRSLNWVHLATRFPVRIRITSPVNDVFRLGESAVVVIRGESNYRSKK